MRFLQIVIVVALLLCILGAFVYLQSKNAPRKTVESEDESDQHEVSPYRSAKIFIFVIGISVVVLCTTIVLFHLLG